MRRKHVVDRIAERHFDDRDVGEHGGGDISLPHVKLPGKCSIAARFTEIGVQTVDRNSGLESPKLKVAVCRHSAYTRRVVPGSGLSRPER